MNESLRTADRLTHAKIAMLASLGCIVFIAVGMSARTSAYHQTPTGRSTQSINVNATWIEKRFVDVQSSPFVTSFELHASSEGIRH